MGGSAALSEIVYESMVQWLESYGLNMKARNYLGLICLPLVAGCKTYDGI